MNLRQTAIQLIAIGLLMITTPFLIAGSGEDTFTSLVSKLPLNKIFLMRALTISGVMFILTGCMIW